MTSQNPSATELELAAHSPDIETASADYATRFAGKSGEYLLSVQNNIARGFLLDFPDAKILEVGGGHGQLRGLYSELGNRYVLQGSRSECFDLLEDAGPNESRTICDLRQLPYEDNEFDVVIAIRLLCHLSDWDTVYREMCRVAKCAVIIDFPTKRSLNALTPLLFSVKKKIEKNTRHYETFHPSSFTAIPTAHGFDRIRRTNQFFLPMVVHRVLGGNIVARFVESVCRGIGLTACFGSPVLQIAQKDKA